MVHYIYELLSSPIFWAPRKSGFIRLIAIIITKQYSLIMNVLCDRLTYIQNSSEGERVF